MRPNETNLSLDAKRARRKVIHDICIKVHCGEKDVFSQSLLIYPWLTRHMVNGSMRRMKLKRDKEITTDATMNNSAIVIP